VEEAKQVAAHIRKSPKILGFTGGEPLLLGCRLREVLDCFGVRHPTTQFDVLTNGRLLSDPMHAKELLDGLTISITWMVPLYGHADFLHDFIVQSAGAFEQTIAGLLTLQKMRQPTQLRVVLIEPVLEVLPALCTFIARNLPFVYEVALMGCEPTGYALANRKVCEVNIRDWHEELSAGVLTLRSAGIPLLLMNLPLCSLPRDLWSLAHRSISDWKQTYADECESCAVRGQCSGLFASHQRGWRPTSIHSVDEIAQ
jgi:His-Xaa-Ser system radical SAM maturase HxsC